MPLKRATKFLLSILIFSLLMPCVSKVEGKSLEKSIESSKRISKKISLKVRGANLLDILDMFAKKTGWNLVVAQEVGGKVSLNLHDVTIEDALAAVAQISGYAIEERGNILYVMPKDKVVGHRFPLRTEQRIFRLHYVDADEAGTIVKESLSSSGKLSVHKETNTLFIEDVPEVFEKIALVLEALDQLPKQVLIEAKLLEVKLNDDIAYGIDWNAVFSSDNASQTIQTQGLSRLPGSGGTGFFFGLTTPDVKALLDALQQEGSLNTLATPRLMALNHKPAKIVIGGSLGFRVTTTTNQVTTESVEFLDIGTQLRITPHIDDDGNILMEIHPEISDGVITEGLPSKTTTEVTTTLLAKDGESIFIGGLIRTRAEEVVKKVPFLGSIPILGYLFRRHEVTNLKSEIVVIITPHLAKDKFRAEAFLE